MTVYTKSLTRPKLSPETGGHTRPQDNAPLDQALVIKKLEPLPPHQLKFPERHRHQKPTNITNQSLP